MKLISINIQNFRSLESVKFSIEPVDNGFTYTLIGVNESGKSSFLKIVSAVTNRDDILYDKDFFDVEKPVIVELNYQLENQDRKNLDKKLVELGFDKKMLDLVIIDEISISARVDPEQGASKTITERILFRNNTISDYTLKENKPIIKSDEQEDDLDLEAFFRNNIPKYFRGLAHKIVFWKSESKYLITEQINLNEFAQSPENISIPLLNCFALADVPKENIKELVAKLQDNPAEINNLAEKLGDNVTAHIKNIWKNHPVSIKFQISFPYLFFLVEDEKVKYQSKTVAQRSDGFRQFLSFLLTVSAEKATNKFTNVLLLLDEPETHLHPRAQEYLMDELIAITKGAEKNIIVYATHSNHMIDKNHIERCFRVTKSENNRTTLERIELGKTTYAEVNYDVFEIVDSDYHNELYGYLEAEYPDMLNSLPKNLNWFNVSKNKNEKVSLPTYIRHSIHHPENTRNKKFNEGELKKSIKALRKLKIEANNKTG